MKNVVMIISAIFFLFIDNAFGQNRIDSTNYVFSPSPIIGWDSLKSIIERPETYPEIPKRAGMIGQISLIVVVDSIGALIEIKPNHVRGLDSLFIPPLEKILRSIKWIPGSLNGKRINNVATLDFTFCIISDNPQSFFISAPAIKVKEVH